MFIHACLLTAWWLPTTLAVQGFFILFNSHDEDECLRLVFCLVPSGALMAQLLEAHILISENLQIFTEPPSCLITCLFKVYRSV